MSTVHITVCETHSVFVQWIDKAGEVLRTQTVPYQRTFPDGLDALEESLPNLEAVLSGCVSGNVTEWPLIREELKRLWEKYRDGYMAVLNHYSQKADDLCVLDDNLLYAAFGLPQRDNRVGDPEAMLENCKRFIQNRCQGGGPWKPYVELEKEIEELKKDRDRWKRAYLETGL